MDWVIPDGDIIFTPHGMRKMLKVTNKKKKGKQLEFPSLIDIEESYSLENVFAETLKRSPAFWFSPSYDIAYENNDKTDVSVASITPGNSHLDRHEYNRPFIEFITAIKNVTFVLDRRCLPSDDPSFRIDRRYTTGELVGYPVYPKDRATEMTLYFRFSIVQAAIIKIPNKKMFAPGDPLRTKEYQTLSLSFLLKKAKKLLDDLLCQFGQDTGVCITIYSVWSYPAFGFESYLTERSSRITFVCMRYFSDSAEERYQRLFGTSVNEHLLDALRDNMSSKYINEDTIKLWTSLALFVSEECKNRDKSHGFDHMRDVAHLSLEIYDMERKSNSFYNDNTTVRYIMIVAWLHDVADHKYDGSNELAKKQRVFLEETLKLPTEEIQYITNIIDRISYSKENKIIKDGGQLDWIQVLGGWGCFIRDIVSDADKLEAIGSIGIQRCREYAQVEYAKTHNGQPIPKDLLCEQVRQHAKDKLLRIKDEFIRTQTGKMMAIPKHNEMVSLLEMMHI